MRRRLLAVSLAWLAMTAAAHAQPADNAIDLSANSLHYQEDGDVVRARGNVELLYDRHRVRSEELIWRRSSDQVFSAGPTELKLPDGAVVTGERVRLRDRLRKGRLTNFRTLFSDKRTQLAAQRATRNEKEYVLQQGFFTPCRCAEDAATSESLARQPIWSVRSWRSRLDRESDMVSHTHAVLQVKGVPVAYTPYFSHVSPEVDRKSGFLAPIYDRHNVTGYNVALPFFFNLAPNYDLTLTPRWSSIGGYIQEAQWRHLVSNGRYQFYGVGTIPDRQIQRDVQNFSEFRGSLFGRGRFETKPLAYGFRAQIISDKDFLRHYNRPEYETLQNSGWMNYAKNNVFMRLEGIAYGSTIPTQGNLRRQRILPWAQLDYRVPQPVLGGRLLLSGDIVNLYREVGDDVLRSSLGWEWQRRFLPGGGVRLDLTQSARGDVYSYRFENSRRAVPRENFDLWRNFASVSARLSYPLVKHGPPATYIVEPIAQLTYAYGDAHHDRIVDEDGQITELASDNLFVPDRFSGKDREETGLHVAYGGRAQSQWRKWHMQMQVGQSWQMDDEQGFRSGSGLDTHRSDYVASAALSGYGLTLWHGVRLSEADFAPRRLESALSWRGSFLRLSAGHVVADRVLDSRRRQEQVYGRARLELGRYWSLRGRVHYDLIAREPLRSSAAIIYDDECLRIRFAFRRIHSFQQVGFDRDSFTLSITLKTLTTVTTGGIVTPAGRARFF